MQHCRCSTVVTCSFDAYVSVCIGLEPSGWSTEQLHVYILYLFCKSHLMSHVHAIHAQKNRAIYKAANTILVQTLSRILDCQQPLSMFWGQEQSKLCII